MAGWLTAENTVNSLTLNRIHLTLTFTQLHLFQVALFRFRKKAKKKSINIRLRQTERILQSCNHAHGVLAEAFEHEEVDERVVSSC